MSKYSFVFIIYISSVVFLLFLSIIVAIPKTPISVAPNLSAIIGQVIPQGWGFFSRDPREPMLYAYSVDDNEKLVWPNSSPDNYFGLKRYGRAQGIELGSISSQVSIDNYTPCENLSGKCKDLTEFIPTINEQKNPSICGRWVITNIEPVPWAWGSDYKNINMNAEAVGVEVDCSRN
ncbi:SdpA family antimicrobial peptide system protein [Alkalihalophilus marmarensis]|uniref:SdpA family antimicrobial peptide system protein n=1 Tax=Alkalihalophilus marmarensis TaxID=521377 RepID=UPI002DBEDDC6|nr:SdpA family antimicrobial peptide system protein [Alkalihalophilus marmarensis]MEC2071429.1 SdpA family antimicrobial peptide system protein [Alkalihalophilus marmarensis]